MKSKISLCLIAGSNEDDHIKRCVKSFSQFVDEVSLVFAEGETSDEGDLDLIGDYIREFGIVCKFGFYRNKKRMPHCDDFAAARNLSFVQASGDWLIWADCDDTLPNTEDNKTFFDLLRSGKLDGFDSIKGNWVIQNAGGHSFVRERIVKKSSNPQWIFPVHELILPKQNAKEVYAKEFTIVHDPIVSSPEELAKRSKEHGERNLRILRYSLHRDEYKKYRPELIFLWMRETYLLGHYQEAQAAGGLVLKYQRGIAQDSLQEARMMLGRMAIANSNIPEARMQFLSAFGTDPSRREALYELAKLDMIAGRYDRMLGYTSAARGIPLKPAHQRPYNCDLASYGWYGAKLHASALRLNKRIEEAESLERDIFLTEKGKISIIHPTKCQPGKAIEVKQAWILNAQNQGGIDWIFATDKNDKTAYALSSDKCVASEEGVPEAIRVGLSECKGGIIGLISDEFFPAPGWDSIVIEALSGGQNVAWIMGTDCIFLRTNGFKYAAPDCQTFYDFVHSIIQGAIKDLSIAIISLNPFHIPPSEWRLKDRVGIYPHTIKNKNRFIIVAKQGRSPYTDFQPFYAHTELGWEATVFQLEAKHLLCSGELHPDDTIVTLPGREFLYTNQFKKVITFEEYCNIKNLKYGEPYVDASDTDTLDLVRQKERNAYQFKPWFFADNGKYLALPGEMEAIYNIERKVKESDHDYICMALRFRPHCSERNTSKDFSQSLLEGIRSVTNLPIYLVGLDLPPLDVKDVYHADLCLWTSLTMLPNCKAIVTPLTGPANLAWIYAKPPTKFIVFPRQYCASFDDRSIVTGMGESINFNRNTRTVLPICCPIETIVEQAKESFK